MSALGMASIAVLSGCFKVDMQMELQSDDTVDGSIILAVARDQAELLGGEDAIRQSLQGEDGGIFSDAPDEGTFDQRDYEDDDWIGTEATFSDVPIDEFGQGTEGSDFSITRDGDEFVVEGTMPAAQQLQDPSAQQMLDTAEIQITVTFPGDVTEANGAIDGNQVTWEPTPGEAVDITARGSAESGMNWILIGAIAALLALVAIGVVLLMIVRGRDTAADGPTDDSAGEMPPATPPLSSSPSSDVPSSPPPTQPPAPPAPPAPPPTEPPGPPTPPTPPAP